MPRLLPYLKKIKILLFIYIKCIKRCVKLHIKKIPVGALVKKIAAEIISLSNTMTRDLVQDSTYQGWIPDIPVVGGAICSSVVERPLMVRWVLGSILHG